VIKPVYLIFRMEIQCAVYLFFPQISIFLLANFMRHLCSRIYNFQFTSITNEKIKIHKEAPCKLSVCRKIFVAVPLHKRVATTEAATIKPFSPKVG
jgi:hypothetical protein